MSVQKITIDPVTRIEGHAKITIHLDGNNQVERATLHINEFRGFEKFCEGRSYLEMPAITPRICGICPVSHHLAAAKAGDTLAGSPPPRPASLLRELMHMGQIIQSHGMHFFELAGPDLILGIDQDPANRNLVGMLAADPGLTLEAINLRKFGQEIIHTLGGRRIHPNFAVPGGVNKSLTMDERQLILSGVEQSIATVQTGLKIFKNWAEKHQEDIQKFAVFATGYLGMVAPGDALEFYDGDLRLVDQDGQQLELFPANQYLEMIAERVENWTYLKFPYYRKLGYPAGVYRVGSLGRLNTIQKIDTPLAHKEWLSFKALNPGKPVENSLYYHYARLIEILYAIERVQVLLDDSDILSQEILNTCKNWQGEGIGVLEAPRGTLIHHYWADENGRLERINLIVATGHNNWAMSTAVDSVAKTYIHGPEITEGMLNRVEAALRAYDPCLSCSTHAIGQVPFSLDVLDVEGNLVKTIC